MILLADANVLIDLAHVNGLEVLTQLGKIEVLDVVFDECTDPLQTQSAIASLGIQKINTIQEWYQSAIIYRQGNLSIQDVLCFYYAKKFNRTLLVNEKPLRKLCQKHEVSYHGTLWIVQQAYKKAIVPREELCNWLMIWSHKRSRMPKEELLKLKAELKC